MMEVREKERTCLICAAPIPAERMESALRGRKEPLTCSYACTTAMSAQRPASAECQVCHGGIPERVIHAASLSAELPKYCSPTCRKTMAARVYRAVKALRENRERKPRWGARYDADVQLERLKSAVPIAERKRIESEALSLSAYFTVRPTIEHAEDPTHWLNSMRKWLSLMGVRMQIHKTGGVNVPPTTT